MEKKIKRRNRGQTTIEMITKTFVFLGIVGFLLVLGAFVWDSFSEIGFLSEQVKLAEIPIRINYLRN